MLKVGLLIMMFDLKAICLDLRYIETKTVLLEELAKAFFFSHGIECKNLDACIDVLSSLRIANHSLSRLVLKQEEVIALHVLFLDEAKAAIRQAIMAIVTGVNERVREMGQYPLLYLLLDNLPETQITAFA